MYIPQFNYHTSFLYPLTQTTKPTLKPYLPLKLETRHQPVLVSYGPYSLVESRTLRSPSTVGEGLQKKCLHQRVVCLDKETTLSHLTHVHQIR